MWIRFEQPLWLLLLPLVATLVIKVSRQSLAGLWPGQAISSLAMRLVLVSLLVMAIAGPQSVRPLKDLCSIYVLDVSKSISGEGLQEALTLAGVADEKKRPGDKSGLIVFGRDTQLEALPSPGSLPVRITAQLDETATDIAAALRLAIVSFPEKYSRQIVLLSDGNETDGDAAEQARIARASGISVDTIKIGKALEKEAWIEAVESPQTVRYNEPYTLRVIAGSTVDQKAVVRLYRDGHPMGEVEVMLNKGRSALALPQKGSSLSSHRYQVVMEPQSDTEPENNVGSAFVRVEGPPSLWLVSTEPHRDSAMISALRAAGLDPVVKAPSGLPVSPSGYLDTSALILSNVSAEQLTDGQMKSIRSAVQHVGMGFIHSGGEKAFGAGGYYQTPIEEVSPVKMTVRENKARGKMSVLIIIDKSGSMGAIENGTEKIRLANEAAVACLGVLRPDDKLAVIACDTMPDLVAPLRPASQAKDIADDIRSIRVGGGGILMYTSMVRGYEVMQNADTRIRHIIFLADGSDAEEQMGCFELAQRMVKEGITISTVAIGNGPDVPFLKSLAKEGKGSFYLTETASNLPKIFTKDTMLASRTLIVEEPVKPIVSRGMEPLLGLDFGSVPQLGGYIATTPKERATVQIKVADGDPILASWQYGLGRSIAFTSDSGSRWAAGWTKWAVYPAFWAQNARWALKRTNQGPWQAEVKMSGGRARVVANSVDDAGEPIGGLELKLRAILPDGQTLERTLDQTGAGRYEATIPASQSGDYIVSVEGQGQYEGQSHTVSASVAYPEEFRTVTPNEMVLRNIAEVGGGRYLPPVEEIVLKASRVERRTTDIWFPMALLALFMLPVDVAMRRLVFRGDRISAVYEQLKGGLHSRRQKAQAPVNAPSGALATNSRRRKETQEPEKPQPPVVIVSHSDGSGQVIHTSTPQQTEAEKKAAVDAEMQELTALSGLLVKKRGRR